ncbi:MAG: hypothetical protein QW507_00190 [Candidatus Nanoarchaeia archaeon]|nr:hypothetical protein [Candidatus Haiyanarchaeum thermophilum]MCW1302998.1 hypothetical protein [Candidatus Haiyanarchaeum thermophilum]MCW1303676.1 hypothetical protein [Candidatus Haiyanarchaeum thermophilum]MCW1306356.1 hypothetical protein [Candidatus Haiyanarchaeum thermophilum]MCW1307134.1 hypothetical protein [Candidatus Haiyanarchaeum thermophilum]
MKEVRIMGHEEVRRVLEIISQRFSIEPKLNYVFLIDNRGKVFICSPDIVKLDLKPLWRRIQRIGLYFGFFESSTKFRLSVEASQLLGKIAKKNVVELTEEEALKWLNGLDLERKMERGIVILKYGDDFLGSGLSMGGKIKNLLPKERRVKRELKLGSSEEPAL